MNILEQNLKISDIKIISTEHIFRNNKDLKHTSGLQKKN